MLQAHLITQIAALSVLLNSCVSGPPTYVRSNSHRNIAITQSKQATITHSVEVEDDIVLAYEGFYVSYDEKHLIPRWVEYTLSANEIMSTPPPTKAGFQQDNNLTIKQADYSDYRGSGWSRGHMAPAADFKWSAKAYEGTFVYTNCCPQNATLNNGSWNMLENKVRKWAGEYGEIIVVTGPIIGDNKNGTIGSNHVIVPDAFFKALLIRVNDEYSCVGFIMTNTADKQTLLDSFVSINRLEAITGFNFFPQLDDEFEDVIEGIVDRTIWQF